MVIHACQSLKAKKDNQTYSKDDVIKLSERFGDGLSNPKSGPKAFTDNRNPYGFCVRATNSGSMTRDSFYDWVLHFIKSLPAQDKYEDGVNTKPHLLILDGHTSQWNREAFEVLMKNNVFPFFLPSHTSVWTQPNDCGSNKRLHVSVEKVVKQMRRNCQKYDVALFNLVIRAA